MKKLFFTLAVIISLPFGKGWGWVSFSQSVYCRPFNLGGCVNHAGQWKMLEDSATVFKAMQDSFAVKPTMLVQVIQRIDTPYYNAWVPYINHMKQITPNIFFGIGDATDTLTNTSVYNHRIAMLTKFINNTKCLALENFTQTVRQTNNDTIILQYLTDMHNLGFQHIMATDYQPRSNFQPWPYIDAIMVPVNKHTLQLNISKMDTDQLYQPNAQIILNYENPNGEKKLDSLTNAAAVNIMTEVADSQNLSIPSYKWMPVWSSIYDAYQKGTLKWMAQKLSQIDSCSSAVSVEQLTNEQSLFSISPNPSSGIFQIQAAGGSGSEYKIEIYNLLGEKVFSKIVNSKLETVNLNEVSGIYFYRIVSEEKNIAVGKLIVQQ
ncbi:MAG: T9SS type A sorting domain-containing protein [Bacteroidetes bacterium]|nr:T9SS type A sorting domain-containing protein [Bacteroidota bacterium]